MPEDLFKRLVQEVSEAFSVNTVLVHVAGEPLLYPSFFDAMQCIMDSGLKTCVATNGSLLRPEHHGLPVDFYISISVTKEDFSYRRSGLTFAQYYDQTTDFIRYRKAHHIPGKITIQVSEMKEFLENRKTLNRNIVDYESMAVKMAKLVRDIDIEDWDAARLREAIERNGTVGIYSKEDFHILLRAHKIVATNWRLCYQNYEEMPCVSYGYCDAPWKFLVVLWDGTVTHCCTDLSGRTVIGNVNHASLQDIWFGRKAKAVRRAFERWKVPHGICRRCLHRISENAKLMIS